jgi:hypothetical protein
MSIIGRALYLFSAKTYATWNPSDKGTNISLSGSNLIATLNGAGLVRSTIGKSSGKWYWEVSWNTSSASQIGTGVATASAGLNAYLGNDVSGYGYYGNAITRNNGGTAAYGASYATGDVIGVALDMDAGTLTFYKNNVSQGVAYSGLSGTFYPSVGATGATSAHTATVNFGATAFTYSPPAGYNAGVFN